jgi:hypothetical protein
MPQGNRARSNLRWGLGWTLSVATLFSCYVLVLTLLRGSTHFEQLGMTAWQMIAGYYAAAIVSGVLLALLRPFADRRYGALLVGALVGASIYGAIGVAMYGFRPVVGWVALIVAPFAGGLGVVIYDGGLSFSTRTPGGRLWLYAVALIVAVVLLWLDMQYHIFNK